ncbi:MAG: TIGR00730 family Rossman fold protein [Bdellovibrio sp.]|nr:TIGR00730 family Rossman fold protein [Bdellovibrio sp.]
MKIKRICVYCGANSGNNPEFAKAAKELGHLIAAHKIELVYGGGKAGLMGVVADAVIEKQGTVIGIIPQSLVRQEHAHHEITELRVVNSMHERKATMASMADAFIALPGGFGTLEEMFEVLTWSQIGYHEKPVALVNTAEYYTHLRTFVDHAISTGLIRQEYARYFQVAETPAKAMDMILR